MATTTQRRPSTQVSVETDIPVQNERTLLVHVDESWCMGTAIDGLTRLTCGDANYLALSKDPATLLVAEAVYAVFGDSGSPEGLTRAELAAACADVVLPRIFESRFGLFVDTGLLQRSRDKQFAGCGIGHDLADDPLKKAAEGDLCVGG